MFKSTYEAYQNVDAAYDDPTVMGSGRVLFGHVRQSEIVLVGLDGAVARDVEERINSIWEGVHILPGKLKDPAWHEKDLKKRYSTALKGFGMRLLTPEDYLSHIIELFVDISDPNLHRQRLEERELYSPDRPAQKYLENFESIRLIRDFMFQMAARNSIPIIQNVNLEDAVKECIKQIAEKSKGDFVPVKRS